MIVRVALIAAAALAPLPAMADAALGTKLMQENRVREAREQFERGAAKGELASRAMLTLFLWHGYDEPPRRHNACLEAADPALAKESMAQAVLAHCHLAGIGVAKDLAKARALARASALGGNNEARFVYYLSMRAAHPATAVEATDMLARAAQTGHRDSLLALAGYYFETLGAGNRGKARTLYAQIPRLPEAAARASKTLSEVQRTSAESPLTAKIVLDAQPAVVRVAIAAAGDSECKDIRLTSTAMAGPIQGAVWLPHTHSWVERSALVSGNWEEDWHYALCGKEVIVRIRFDADRKGGASFRPLGATR